MDLCDFFRKKCQIPFFSFTNVNFFLVSLVFCDCKLNTVEFWTDKITPFEVTTLGFWDSFHHFLRFYRRKYNIFIEKIIKTQTNNEKSHFFAAQLATQMSTPSKFVKPQIPRIKQKDLCVLNGSYNLDCCQPLYL